MHASADPVPTRAAASIAQLIDEAWAQHHRDPARLVALGTAIVNGSAAGGASAGQGWLQVAWGLRFRGDSDGAAQALQRADDLATRTGDAALSANVWDLQAQVAGMERRHAEARALLTRSAAVSRAQRSPWERLRHHQQWAWMHDTLGERDEALRARYDAVAAARETADPAPLALALGLLCGAQVDGYNLEEAEALGAQALALAEQCGAFNAWTLAALNRLNALVALGRGADGLALVQRLQAQEPRMNARAAEQRCVVYADVHLQAGDGPQAQVWLDRSMQQRNPASDSRLSWTTVQVQAWLAAGRADEARGLAEAWLADPQHGTDPASVPSELLRLLQGASQACEVLGDLGAALQHQRRAFRVHEQLVGRSARARRLALEVGHQLDRERWDREQAQQRQQSAETEGRRLDALNRALGEANAAKTRFLAAASHDLRQPVQALAMFLAALQRESLAPGSQQLVDRMARSLDALTGLFDALLDVSRLDAGAVPVEARPLALALLLQRLADEHEPLAAARGLQLRLHLPAATRAAHTHTDPLLLERCLRNLLDNALKYTERGGVVLALRPPRHPGGPWRVQVADTGIGMPPAVQQQVFEEFFQAANPERDRRRGLGLGLAIVQRVATLLALPVGLRSRPGCGSHFWLDLPPHAAPAVASGPAAARAGDAPALRLAVVDDDADVRDALVALLERWGHTVHAAPDAAAVCAQVASAGGAAPQAVISDLRLAGSDDGVAAVAAMRAAYGAGLPALLITGDVAPERLQRLRDSGLPWLAKPVMPMRLRAWLAALASPADAAPHVHP